MQNSECLALALYRVNTAVFEMKDFSLAPLNPFLPTGQFIAPKLIILIKCLIDIFFQSVVF